MEETEELDIPAPMPFDTLFPKQIEIYNVGIESQAKINHPNSPASVLVDGPRRSSKTIGVCHRILRHMWETPKARVALVVKTTGSATDGGVWLDLIDIVIPVWLEPNFGFEYTTFDRDGNPGPKTDSKTRTIYFRIRNYYGGESELRLIPLEHDHEVKQRFKSGRFSCVWFSELSNFKDPSVFRTTWQQLRMYHLKPWQHLWVGDTNPSDEGEDSWIYQQWYRKRGEMLKQEEELGRSLYHIHVKMSDNLSLTPEMIQVYESLYKDDAGEHAREFEGRWVKGHGNKGKHFADVFFESIHIIGGAKGEGNTIEVSPATTDLFTGWDLGGSVNHAAGIIEKRIIRAPDDDKEWSVFCILDSLKYVNEQKSIGSLGLEMLEKIRALEKRYGRKFGWTHYSDETAINVFRPSSNSFDYLEIQIATDNEINLEGVPKPANSVQARVRLVRRLLRERRLYVANQCYDVILMFQQLKQGSKQSEYVMWNEHKHVFDWISYVLFMECAAELEEIASRPSSSQAQVSDLSMELV